MANHKKTKLQRKAAVTPKYNVGMPNPYTKGSDIHKMWELVIQHPEKIRLRNANGNSHIYMSSEDFHELCKTYELIGVTPKTMSDLWPPVYVYAFSTNGRFAGDYHYVFKVFLPRKHYQLFRSLRNHCLNLKKGGYTSMTGIEYGNT